MTSKTDAKGEETVHVTQDGRADAAIAAAFPQLLRAERLGLFSGRKVRRGGAALAKGDEVRVGDELLVQVNLEPWIVPSADPTVVVLHQTSELLYLSKPAAMPCHPLRRGEGGTLVDVVASFCPAAVTGFPAQAEGGLCHRLDNDTSGVVVFAKTLAAHQRTRAAFAAGEVEKRYIAVVEGEVRERMEVSLPIAHHRSDKARMVVQGDGESASANASANASASASASARGQPRSATTVFEPLVSGPRSLVEVSADRGRRHQVRVHAAHLGHPLAGDVRYGGQAAPGLAGHALHALWLELPGERRVTSPLPPEMAELIAALGQEFRAHLASLAGVS